MRAIHRLALLAMLGLASVTLKATDGCSMASLWFSGADQFWCQTSGRLGQLVPSSRRVDSPDSQREPELLRRLVESVE